MKLTDKEFKDKVIFSIRNSKSIVLEVNAFAIDIEDYENREVDPCIMLDKDYGEYRWKPTIDFINGKILNWRSKTYCPVHIHYKIRDEFTAKLTIYPNASSENNLELYYEGYVPDEIMCPNGKGYGDYVSFIVDPDGSIQGWNFDNVKRYFENIAEYDQTNPFGNWLSYDSNKKTNETQSKIEIGKIYKFDSGVKGSIEILHQYEVDGSISNTYVMEILHQFDILKSTRVSCQTIYEAVYYSSNQSEFPTLVYLIEFEDKWYMFSIKHTAPFWNIEVNLRPICQ